MTVRDCVVFRAMPRLCNLLTHLRHAWGKLFASCLAVPLELIPWDNYKGIVTERLDCFWSCCFHTNRYLLGRQVFGFFLTVFLPVC